MIMIFDSYARQIDNRLPEITTNIGAPGILTSPITGVIFSLPFDNDVASNQNARLRDSGSFIALLSVQRQLDLPSILPQAKILPSKVGGLIRINLIPVWVGNGSSGLH
jgi:hypothetical protein